jgi:hypothetical protein
MSPWIPDTCFSRSRGTKKLKTVELYGHVTTLIAYAIKEEKGSRHDEIRKKLDQLDQKYENLINAIWGSNAGSEEDRGAEHDTKAGEEGSRK